MNWSDSLFILAMVAACSNLIPLGIAIRCRKNLERSGIILLVYLAFIVCLEVIYITLAANKQNNMPVAHVYNAAESAFILTYLRYVLKSYFYQKLYPYLLSSLLLIAFIDTFLINTVFEASVLSRPLNCILYAVLAISCLNQLIADQGDKPLTSIPHFWFSIAMLFRFTGIFILSLFLSVLLKSYPDIFDAAWYINNVLYLSFNTLLVIGFLKWKRKV